MTAADAAVCQCGHPKDTHWKNGKCIQEPPCACAAFDAKQSAIGTDGQGHYFEVPLEMVPDEMVRDTVKHVSIVADGGRPDDEYVPTLDRERCGHWEVTEWHNDSASADVSDLLVKVLAEHQPLTDDERAQLICDVGCKGDHSKYCAASSDTRRVQMDSDELVGRVESILLARETALREQLAKAWDNGVDTAGQYAEQPWVVDDECKPLNPYRRGRA